MSILKKISYNCKQATFLIEKKQKAKLSIPEVFTLKYHLMGCSVCKLFQTQSLTINELIKELLNNSKSQSGLLDETYKKNLQSRIEKEMSDK